MQLITEAELLALSPAMLEHIRYGMGMIDGESLADLAARMSRSLEGWRKSGVKDRNRAMRQARKDFGNAALDKRTLWQLNHAAKCYPLTAAQRAEADLMRRAIAARKPQPC